MYDDPVCAVSEFSLRRFEHPGRLAICALLTSVNLKSSCMRCQGQLFTGRRFNLVRNLRLSRLLRKCDRKQAQKTSDLSNS